MLSMEEVESIMKQCLIKIDKKTRTDSKFPTGVMDVVQIKKTGENFRIIYDVKGRCCHQYKVGRLNLRFGCPALVTLCRPGVLPGGRHLQPGRQDGRGREDLQDNGSEMRSREGGLDQVRRFLLPRREN
jgi:hypothetical protein